MGPIHQLAKAHVPVPSWSFPRPTPWTSSPPNPRPHSFQWFPCFLCFPWQVHGEWDPAPGHVDPGTPRIQCSTPAQRPQRIGPSDGVPKRVRLKLGICEKRLDVWISWVFGFAVFGQTLLYNNPSGVKSAEEGPRMPKIIGRGAQGENAAILFAEAGEIHPTIT